LFKFSATAQTADTSKHVFQLGQVNIIGTKDSLRSNKLSSGIINLYNRLDVSHALSLLPGITLTSIGPRNESAINVRGFDIHQVPIYLDGVPLYVPYDGYVDLARYSTFNLSAITQFERTLISCNSKYDQYLRGAYQPTADELKGMTLFNNAAQPEKGIRGANCAHCHGGAKNYMELFHNNGLDSIPKDAGVETISGQPSDKGRFKVPTLRNIALTAPYMHDGRFKTLDEVIDHYSEHIKESAYLSAFLRGESNEPGGKSLKLLPHEKKELIAFLNMLTDSTFVHNPDFSDPHLLKKAK
jgi:hypothetical protein